jgi:hypothetical protein
VAQGVGREFKPQYPFHPPKKRKKEISHSKFSHFATIGIIIPCDFKFLKFALPSIADNLIDLLPSKIFLFFIFLD